MNPQPRIQNALIGEKDRAVAERDKAVDRLRMYSEMYNKLSRRFELLVARKRVEMKKPEDYTVKELLTALAGKFTKLFQGRS